jgi:hypothetical protein
MSEEPLVALLKTSLATDRYIAEMTSTLSSLRERWAKGERTPRVENELLTLVSKISAAYEQHDVELQRITDRIAAVQDQLSTSPVVPREFDRDDLKARVDEFFHWEPRFVDPPYPPLCGSRRHSPSLVIPPGSFVCMKYEQTHILGIVADLSADGLYQVYDAMPAAGMTAFLVPPAEITPLAKFLPREIPADTDFMPRDKVLALYCTGGSWTTEFYAATIDQALPVRGAGYVVRYESEPQNLFVVPDHYIVAIPGSSRRLRSSSAPIP